MVFAQKGGRGEELGLFWKKILVEYRLTCPRDKCFADSPCADENHTVMEKGMGNIVTRGVIVF